MVDAGMNLQKSLGMLVPNSREWHEKNGNQILCTSKHIWKLALLEKSLLNSVSILNKLKIQKVKPI